MSLLDTVSSIAERLSCIPGLADVALVIRHAEREVIPTGAFGLDVPLTVAGITEAERLGEAIRSFREHFTVVSSRVPRCVQTGEAILRGAGCLGKIALDRRLGDPGPFVVDIDATGTFFLELPVPEIVRRQLHEAEPLPGMRPTADGVEKLLSLTADELENNGRLNVYVTHDAILAVLVASLFRLPLAETGWPGYLEGLLLWRSSGRLRFSWRSLQQTSHSIGG